MQAHNITSVTLVLSLAVATAAAAGTGYDHLREVGTIAVGEAPAYVACSKDGSKVYIARRARPIQNRSAGGHGWLEIVDTVARTVKAIDMGAGFPCQIVVSPDGKRAYMAISQALGNVVSNGYSRLAVIDLEREISLMHIGMPGGQYGAFGVAVTPDGRKVYVTQRGGDSVWAVDAVAMKRTSWIPFYSPYAGSRLPTGIAVSPDGRWAYACNRKDNTVGIIDTATDKIVAGIRLALPFSLSHLSIAITPDGTRAYIAPAMATAKVAVLDLTPADPRLRKQLPDVLELEGSLNDLKISADGSRLLATSAGASSGRVLVVDIRPGSAQYHRTVASAAVGLMPAGVALTESGELSGFVANSGASTLSLLGAGVLEVAIDVKPGDAANRVNVLSRGRLPVAILSTADADATAVVDRTSLAFGRDGTEAHPLAIAEEDVDGDGRTDLILHFDTAACGLRAGDRTATLTGRTVDGQPLLGVDAVEAFAPGRGQAD